MIILLALSGAAHASARMPADVERFVERRETCDHFRGEIPDSAEIERNEEVTRQIERYCRGTDRQLARLKKKYSHNAVVLERLRPFEPRIESGAGQR